MRKSKTRPTKWAAVAADSASTTHGVQSLHALSAERQQAQLQVELFVKNRQTIAALNHLLRVCNNLSELSNHQATYFHDLNEYTHAVSHVPADLQAHLSKLNIADGQERKQIIQLVELTQHRLLKENKTFLKFMNEECLLENYQQRIEFIETKHRVEKLRAAHFHTDMDALVTLAKAIKYASSPATLEKGKRLLDKWQEAHPRLMSILSESPEALRLSTLTESIPQLKQQLQIVLDHLRSRVKSLSHEEIQILHQYCLDHRLYEHVDFNLKPSNCLQTKEASRSHLFIVRPVIHPPAIKKASTDSGRGGPTSQGK